VGASIPLPLSLHNLTPLVDYAVFLKVFDLEIMMRWRVSSARIHVLDSVYMCHEVIGRLT
jgi:hypothetical protein